MKLYDEFGRELHPYTGETYYNETIYFDKDEENQPSIEVTVDCSGSTMVIDDENNTFTPEHYEAVEEFIQEIKKWVIDNAKDILDQCETRNYLNREFPNF